MKKTFNNDIDNSVVQHQGLTHEMMNTIQAPNSLHLKLGSNITTAVKFSFDQDQGYVNAKDFQIHCLIEYEALRNKGIKNKKRNMALFKCRTSIAHKRLGSVS